MKKSILSFLAFVSVLSLLTFHKAEAATVEILGTFLNPLEAGASGVIATKTTSFGHFGGNRNGYVYDFARGFLAGNTVIEFTYTMASRNGSLDNQSNMIGFLSGTGVDSVTSWNKLPTIERPGKDIISYQGVLTLANLGSTPLFFSSLLFSFLSQSTLMVNTTYSTMAASAVPLPAALPLFALGLAGLAGYKLSRKNKTAA